MKEIDKLSTDKTINSTDLQPSIDSKKIISESQPSNQETESSSIDSDMTFISLVDSSYDQCDFRLSSSDPSNQHDSNLSNRDHKSTTSFIINSINKLVRNGFHLLNKSTSDHLKSTTKLESKSPLIDHLELDLANELEYLSLSDAKSDVSSRIIRILNESRIKSYSTSLIDYDLESKLSLSSTESIEPTVSKTQSKDESADSTDSTHSTADSILPSTSQAKLYESSLPALNPFTPKFYPSKNQALLSGSNAFFPSLSDARQMYKDNKSNNIKPQITANYQQSELLSAFPPLGSNYTNVSKPIESPNLQSSNKKNRNSISLNLDKFLSSQTNDANEIENEQQAKKKVIKIPDDVKECVCYYCKLENPYGTIKCVDCGIYFCNYKGKLKESHIVHHLISSGHNQVDFRLERAFGEKSCCNLCKCDDIFQLGFVPSNKSKNYLICRVPCKKAIEERSNIGKIEIIYEPVFEDYETYFGVLRAKFGHLLINGETKFRADGQGKSYTLPSNTKQEFIDVCNYRSIVTVNKELDPNVLDRLSRNEQKICARVDINKIDEMEKKLQETSKKNRFDILTEDIIQETTANHLDTSLPPILLCYADGTQYKEVFKKHVENEKNLKQLSKEDSYGTEVILSRTSHALSIFETNKKLLPNVIYDSILGKPITNAMCNIEELPDIDIRDLKAPNLPSINESQAEAVNFALKNPLTLIQGPPGTGKTLTSSVLVYNLLKLSLKGKILVSAPSNIACDHLANKIKRTGVNVIRILSRTKEGDKNYHSPLSIHHKLENPELGTELADFIEFLSTSIRISKNDASKLEKLRAKYRRQLIDEADVICVTCCSSVDSRLSGIKFSVLLIDEVCQATEPEIMIPLSVGVKKLIMIGDPCQLAPVIKSRASIELGFDQTLFKRLTILGHKPFMLNKQYRMHPFLSLYSREKFYKGMLKDGITEKDRKSEKFKFQIPNKPLIFLNCIDHEQSSLSARTAPSFLNQKEANVIGKIIYKLINDGIKPKNIGIITPYKGQQEYLKTNLKFFCKGIDYNQIEIASINGYQGREKDYIILSTVRSNKKIHKGAIGFLSDQRRLNVALTRAKYGQIIVGDVTTLVNHPTWYDLIKFYKDHKLLFAGPIGSLNQLTEYRLKKPNPKDEIPDSIFKSAYYIKIEKAKELKDGEEDDDNAYEIDFKKIEFFS